MDKPVEPLTLLFRYSSYEPILKLTIKYFSITPPRMISDSNYRSFIFEALRPASVVSAQDAIICQWEALRLLATGVFDDPSPETIFNFLEAQTLITQTINDNDPWFKIEIDSSEMSTELYSFDFATINFHRANKGGLMN